MADTHAWVRRLVAAAREASDEPDPALDGALRRAVDEASGPAAGAVSLVRRDGRIRTIGSTDTLAAIGDILQFALGDGPCLEAARDGRLVHADDLAADPRWPAWGLRMARDYGAGSVLCLPLFATPAHTGVLSLYGVEPHALDATVDALSADAPRTAPSV